MRWASDGSSRNVPIGHPSDSSSGTLAPMAVSRTRSARYARRRKRRMAKVEHDLSPEEWAALKAAWGGCAYCGATEVPLQRDCVQPIAWGGRYTLDNIVPACRSCNASKWNQEVTSWLRRLRRDEREFLQRWVAVRRQLGESARELSAEISQTT
jgi:hypothetical protein